MEHETSGHHKLRRLRVYGGFLDQLDVEFTAGLNCIIGGRGSGKTTVLEFIRYALDKLPGVDTPAAKAMDERIRSLIAANLGASGCVELDFESQEGLVYHLRRTGVEAPVVTDADGKPIDAKVLQSRVMIDAAIFSHNQIEDISVNPVAQRELLDRLCSHAIGPIAAEVETSAAGLKDNAGQLESLARKLEAAKQDLVDLSSWESKLKVANEALRDEGVPAGLQSAAEHASLRKRERACVDQVGEALARLRAHLAETLPAKIRTLATFVPEELLAGPNGAVMEELARALGRRETELEILLSPVIERVRQLEGEVSRVSETLTAAHGPQDERYRETMALAQAHGARIKVRDEAAREVERLAGVKQALLDLEAARKAAVEERTRLRDSFKAARKRRHEARVAAAASVSDRLGNRVRIAVRPGAEVDAYREFLVSIMKRSGRQYNAPIDRLIAAIPPERLGELCDRGDHEALAASADLNQDFSESLLRALRSNPERRFALDTIDLDDVPSIELKIGELWRRADQLSTGQKSAAILPILLMESAAPLLFDQPEDNLDNSFISDAIVPKLREIKARRQLLMITHNPNIPVLGDAESVCVLEADGHGARLVDRGDLHQVRGHILRLMEGGLAAFRKRQEEYGRGD